MKLIIMLVTVLGIVSVTGCSSPPKQVSQFCHTYKTVDVTDGKTVTSKTTVNCSDDPIDRITLAKTGVAKTCGEYSYWITLKGQPVERKAISCKKWDGTWEVVPAGSTF